MANTIIITGANGSLAIPTVDHLLQHSPDSTLVLTVRDASDKDANTSTLRGVVAKHPAARVSIQELDLSHLSAVHDFARSIAAEIEKGSLPQLSAIVGTAYHWNLVGPLELTDDGYEKTIQVSYLSHFAIVLRLIKSFRPEGGRIVLFTSDGHEPGKNGLEKIPPAISADVTQLDLLVKPAEDASPDTLGHGFHRYANSKLALVMFTHALNRRLERDAQLKNITVVVMNPGNLADSRALLVNTPRKLIILSKFVLRPLRPLLSMSKSNPAAIFHFPLCCREPRNFQLGELHLSRSLNTRDRIMLTLLRNSGPDGTHRCHGRDRRCPPSHQ